MTSSNIIYTKTDEAPALATYSLLPIIQAFAGTAGLTVESRDISLAGRILASFSDLLPKAQQSSDALKELGEIAKTPTANIIKLPNISASVPQLAAAISELQAQGFALPDFPAEPKNAEERDIRARYAKVLGSAVNPVLREGNSDRRVADAVKQYAKKNPHSMGEWSANSQSHVAHMSDKDFYSSEKSIITDVAGTLKVQFESADGTVEVLRDSIPVQAAEVVDCSVMNAGALRDFLAAEIEDAKAENILFSLHLKATMMKVSDPIMFGHAVTVFYEPVFTQYADVFAKIGVNPNNGIGDVYAKIKALDDELQKEIRGAIDALYRDRPDMAMVDSDKGITNLHVPSDVIIDASMPAALRSSGKMWGPDGKLHDTKYVIPDRSYAGIYQKVFDDCRAHGAFDVTTMGSVSNVGLMAQKAEEYGSHDKTFEMTAAGTVNVIDDGGKLVMQQAVEAGDIFRMCQTRDLPIRDWVRLGVNRARQTGSATIFWLDPARGHDRNLIALVERYLNEHDTEGLDIRILSPADAMVATLDRVRDGHDTISVTGNVLRDYLTDLFPILELGTSAKMLSIVPLLAGGGLYETGAGGSAPKHVQQFNAENHLRWDSLGEFLAIAISIAEQAEKTHNAEGKVLATALDIANSQYLENNKSPSRRTGELDNRGSHFYLALYWARALAEQTDSARLSGIFTPVAAALTEQESRIVEELNSVQGRAMDIGGYYRPDDAQASEAMRPSATLNTIIDAVGR